MVVVWCTQMCFRERRNDVPTTGYNAALTDFLIFFLSYFCYSYSDYFDIVIFPGGVVWDVADMIKEEGKKCVTQFVQQGTVLRITNR